MNTKSLTHIEVKDADKGEITAVFATLDVVDSDNDVTRKGAFGTQKVRISAYGHKSWEGGLPVGKGVIREVKNEAILDGQFFLNTTEGRDTFEVVKELGADGLQEFSYGYDPVKFSYGEFEGREVRFLEELKVHEVSPVLLGAGVGTRLLTAKSTLADHIASVLADVDTLITRTADVMAMRSEKGKALGASSADALTSLDGSLTRLKALLATPPTQDIDDELAREYARFVALTTQGA